MNKRGPIHPRPWRPPLGDIRNKEKGAQALREMIEESERKDKEKIMKHREGRA